MAGREQRCATLIEQIRHAFANVSRDGGVSLHEADVIDGYGSQYERAYARKMDIDETWEEVSDSDIARYHWVLSFFDPIGFRYHLPAYMVWALKHVDNTRSDSANSTIYALLYNPNEKGTMRVWRDERFEMFSQVQAEAICEFLRFMVEEAAGMADEWQAQQALTNY